MHPALRRFAAVLLLTLAAIVPAGATSFESEPKFEQSAFDAAQKAGRPILIHVTADWCSVCAQQKVVLEDLLRQPRFKGYALFNIDFDSQKDLLRKFGARSQSTFIVFKGKTQQAITYGDTRPKAIEIMLAKGLPNTAS